MTNYRVASLDGFGDRDDIALERDKQQGQILENQANERAEIRQRLLDAGEYGTSDNAENLSEIVKEMIENEVGSKLVYKSNVLWDIDSIHEAVTEACITLGLGDEEFSPWTNDNGFEIELGLF